VIKVQSAEVKINHRSARPEVHIVASFPLVKHGTHTPDTQGLTDSEIYEKLGRELLYKAFDILNQKGNGNEN
jgi:hypothetical protein